MSSTKPPVNPFYLALVVLGVLFLISACAYFVMAIRANRFGDAAVSSSGQGLMTLLQHHGMAILLVELGLLGIATVGAIGLDQRRQTRDSASRHSAEPPHSTPN